MNVLATFQNDLWKFMDVRALMVIFRLRSCKTLKKITIFFFAIIKKKEFIWITIFSPTFAPNLVILAYKMIPGMPKETGSLNGPLCTSLIRQNLHNRTCRYLRAMNVLATFQNDPRKFADVRVLTVIFHVQSWKMRKIVCPEARPAACSGDDNTPQPLRAVKTNYKWKQ